LFLCIVVTWALDPLAPGFQSYTFPFQIRLIASFLVVFLFTYSFEKIRWEAEERLKVNNRELARQVSMLREADEKIRERTESLEKANRELRSEVAERTRVEAQLREAKEMAEVANRAKSEFLATMSHELRTPLNHILGFTELVLDKHFGDLNPTQEEYLQDVHQSSRHLLSLINDILDISKIEAGKIELRRAPVFLPDVLNNSLNVIRDKALRQGIRVAAEIEGMDETVYADERKVRQILYNLLSNAVKFTPAGGEVRLTAVRTDAATLREQLRKSAFPAMAGEMTDCPEWVRICVRDTGIGLAREHFEMIFRPFEQVDGSLKRQYPGTGLGLALARNLVDLHEGKIWVESEGREKGSSFYVALPLVFCAPPPAAAATDRVSMPVTKGAVAP
ncbi:MAG TPA: ATP-binding protein, partial [Thermodesulfobacteriota bacterium]|nr:ATP-binding protein [Thermodesulfobacteriota bacterium]